LPKLFDVKLILKNELLFIKLSIIFTNTFWDSLYKKISGGCREGISEWKGTEISLSINRVLISTPPEAAKTTKKPMYHIFSVKKLYSSSI